MANCFHAVMGCVSSMLLTLMRVILMISCIFMLLVQIAAIYGIYVVDRDIADLNFPGMQIHFTDYLVIVGSIVVALIGIHGVYTKDPKYLKVFALILSVYALSRVFSFSNETLREDWNKHSTSFQELMSNYAEDYQWNQEPGQKLNKATRAWDLVQGKLLCCGLNGPKDWPQKWKSSQKNVLPKTCCLKLSRAVNVYSLEKVDDKCMLENAYNVGCLDRINDIVDSVPKHALIGAIFYLILGCMSLILAKQSELDRLSCAVAMTTPQYQRFDGSVYVRQQNAQQASFVKQPPVAPSLYPNAHGVEQEDAPPKYGSRT